MTECERIINENILPKEFFDEEYICDFFVDKKRKKVWAIEIDLLLKLDKVCKKHNLRYFLIAGTLLGAVRHKGFIPWDDDIDVIMPRKDYDILCKMGSEWFETPYFLQTPESDEEYYFSFAKLRNSKTTALGYPHRYQNYNHGMGIDIFPLDKCKLETGEENYHKIKKMILENSNYMRNSNPHPSEDDKQRMKESIAKNPMGNCKEINRIASQYEGLEMKYVGILVCTVYHWRKWCFEVEDFDEAIEGVFHGYIFPIPKGYDRILTVEYGEYMKFPPVENRREQHNTTYLEPDIPYIKYKEEILGIYT